MCCYLRIYIDNYIELICELFYFARFNYLFNCPSFCFGKLRVVVMQNNVCIYDLGAVGLNYI